MKLKSLLYIIAVVILNIKLITINCQAQGVGINIAGNPADSSAGLDVSSVNRGLLIPRLTTAQRNAIINPSNSLIIFNTTTQCFETYLSTGASWVHIACIACQLPGSLPGAAGVISGTTYICSPQNSISYSVPLVTNADSYLWLFTGSGFTITAGVGTNTITADFSASATSGSLIVYGINACGNGGISSMGFSIIVNPVLAAAGSINGMDSVCQSQNGVVYSVPSIVNATSYFWSYSGTGATINGSADSVTISFSASATSGILTVRGINACGDSGIVSDDFALTINPLPAVPVVGNATNITETSFSANWASASGATTYYLDAATDNFPSFPSYVVGFNNLELGNVTSFSVSTGITCGTTYYYRVRASNSCGTSINSGVVSVNTVACYICGSPLTDSRDGQIYNTVLIGSQCWMAQNLNYGTFVGVDVGAQNPAGTQKYCPNSGGFNDPTCPFGGLYEWAEMMNGSVSCNGAGAPPTDKCSSPVQGICPNGWHIPSHYEWTTLEKNVGSNPGAFPYNITTTDFSLGTDEGGNLKVTPICGTQPCWNSPNTGATNSSGFTALPSGIDVGAGFGDYNIRGDWWSSTEFNTTTAWYRRVDYGNSKVWRSKFTKTFGLAVRCIKD